MRQIVTIALVLLTAATAAGQRVVSDSAWRKDVKTVTLTREGVELEAPVLTLGGSSRMLLQFDVLADEAENLRYAIAHCDADWHPDDLEPYEFMSGFETGEVEDFEFSFTTLRPYVHYHRVVPERYAQFLYSGNYVLTVTTVDGGDTLLTRRFWVSEECVRVGVEVTRPYDGMDIDRRQEVDVIIKNEELRMKNSTGVALRPEYERVRVQQNGREDNARWLEFSGYDGPALAYRYRQPNIFDGGNTFRYFDCSNLRTPMYNVQRVEEYGGEIFALLRPEEDRSRKHYLTETTLNGGMKVNTWERQRPAVEADYVWVNISLPMAQPLLGGELFVVGQLTDWKLDSASRMDYNPEFKAYVKRLLLKQGYYAYQLLYRPMRAKEGETALLEGNHRETPNRYTVYVYHREPSDRADRLLGVR
ncbi:MAG: type IX secretion system plug protein domain-containing protein [bacterium]